MTDTTEKTAPQTRLGRWRWLLLASLALNLMVAGVVIGHALGDGPGRKVPRVDRIGGPMTFALSHDDRRQIGEALRREYKDGRPSRAQIKAEYSDVITALRSDPYDRARLEAVFARQLSGATDRMAVGQRLLLERIATMTTAERQAFAERLEDGLSRQEKWGRQDR